MSRLHSGVHPHDLHFPHESGSHQKFDPRGLTELPQWKMANSERESPGFHGAFCFLSISLRVVKVLIHNWHSSVRVYVWFFLTASLRLPSWAPHHLWQLQFTAWQMTGSLDLFSLITNLCSPWPENISHVVRNSGSLTHFPLRVD